MGVEGHDVSQFRAGAVRGEAPSGSGGRQALGAATLLLVWQFLFLLLQINVLWTRFRVRPGPMLAACGDTSTAVHVPAGAACKSHCWLMLRAL